MTVINTNIKSLISQNALGLNNRALSGAMEQLSTGKRINSAADDAAGLAISTRMTAQIKGLNQAVRNANDGISLLNTAEGALIEVTNMLQRMRELAVQASNDTNTAKDREYLNLEFQELKAEINRVASSTEWNGKSVLKHDASNTGTYSFQVGARSGQVITIEIPDFTMAPVVINPSQNRQVAEQTFSLSGGTWDGATVLMDNGTHQLSVSLPDEQPIGGISDGNLNDSEAATALVSAIQSSNSSIANLYNFTAVGSNLYIEPSLSNPDRSPLELSIDRNGAQSEMTQNITWADGSTSTNVILADMAYISTTSTTGRMNVISGSMITTSTLAALAIADLDEALDRVNTGRATMGATVNRLTYAGDNLTNVSQNTTESRSRILDTDYAKASSELSRTQIIQQAATAVLAQANTDQQTVLKLLQS